MFQYPEYQLFEENVAKDVAYGPKNMGLSEEETEQRVREALELTGLPYDEFAGRSPFDLSGGQKRRAAIAGILAMRPEILILDEPTAGLDPETHREILDMICRIRETTGATVLLVTHNMDDAARLCDRILVMDQGRLIMEGTPGKVFSQADMLKKIGLGLPSGAEFAWQLKQHGIDIGDGILFPGRRCGCCRIPVPSEAAGGKQMLRDITLGQYYQKDSVIHRLDPRTKILAVILYIILLFFIRDFGGYAVAAVFVGGTIAASGVPLRFILRGMKPIALILLITFIINIFLYPGTIIAAAGPLKITEEGLRAGFFMAFRLLMLVFGTSLLTYTTKPMQADRWI